MATTSQNAYLVPGPQGTAGVDGTNGTNGTNAYTATTSAFTMPALEGTVSVSVGSTSWMVVGQVLYVGNAGYMGVVSITDSTTVVLQNLETSSGAYSGNTTPTTSIPSSSTMSPSGPEGSQLTTASGGSVTGTWPTLNLTAITTKGDLVSTNGTTVGRLGVGSDGTRVKADSSAAQGLQWDKVNLDDTTEVNGTLAVGNGGTGGATAVAGARNLLAGISTTQGAITFRGSTQWDSLAPGNSGYVLRTNGSGANPTFSLPFGDAVTKTATATLTTLEAYIFADATAGAMTLTLPPAADKTGQQIFVVKTDSSISNVVLDGDGSETINGSATYTLSTQYSKVTIISDGTRWFVVSLS